MATDKERWERETLPARTSRTRPSGCRARRRSRASRVQPLYTPEDLAGWRYEERLGYPGEFPYTRGPYPSMYRGQLWTMRMFAGFGRPEDTNARFKYLLDQGQTGLSTAFDMPALMGYDADHPRARGEVGKEGVSISTLADFEILFRDIPLDRVTTSMTINCTASVALAMYLALADKQGMAWDRHRRDHAERHVQGVHRAEGVDLAAGVRGAHRGGHHRVLREARAEASTRCPSPATTSARRARRRCRSWPSPSPTASRTWTRRCKRGLAWTTSRRGCPSSSTSTTTSSRRSPSSGRPGASGPP